MKVTCSQKELENALNIVGCAIGSNNTLPVLDNVLLKAEGKKLYLAATDLEIAIECYIDVTVKNEGIITIPAKLFSNYISFLKEESIDLSLEAGVALSIKSKSSHTKIKGIAATEFPLIPKIEKEKTIEVPANLLIEGINKTIFACSTNIARPVLAGVSFKTEGKKLILATTDSYRLSESQIGLDKAAEEITCIIPAKTMVEVGKVFPKNKEMIIIQLSSNQIVFNQDGIILTSRLIEGQFPDYRPIIPKGIKTKAILNREELIRAFKRVNLFAKENNYNVKLEINPGENLLNITTESTEIGEEKAMVQAVVEGEEKTVALNSQYFIDVLINLDKEEVELQIESKLTPAIVISKGEKDYLHLIMPLKIE